MKKSVIVFMFAVMILSVVLISAGTCSLILSTACGTVEKNIDCTCTKNNENEKCGECKYCYVEKNEFTSRFNVNNPFYTKEIADVISIESLDLDKIIYSVTGPKFISIQSGEMFTLTATPVDEIKEVRVKIKFKGRETGNEKEIIQFMDIPSKNSIEGICQPFPDNSVRQCDLNGDGNNDDGICIGGECVEKENPEEPKCTLDSECQGCLGCDTNTGNCIKNNNKNGLMCDTSSGFLNPDSTNADGFCLSGECKKRDVNNLGLTQPCNSDGGIGLKGCKAYPNEICCNAQTGGGDAGTETCCEFENPNNPVSVCSKVGHSLKGEYTSVCSKNICPADKPVRCPSTGFADRNECCASGSSCLSSGGKWGFPKLMYCGKPVCDNSKGEYIWPPVGTKNPFNERNAVYCCTKYETGIIVSDYPICKPTSCEQGMITCKYQGNYKDAIGTVMCCKPGIETCGYHPGGMPRCISIADLVQGQVSGNNFNFETQTTSVYMIRNKIDFTLNGKAYVITPHVEFNVPVSVSIDYSDVNPDAVDTYKYSNHEAVLESCTNSVLSSVSKIIRQAGGVVNLNNKIKLEMPSEALNEETEFKIEEYNLENCYEIEKDNGVIETILGLLKTSLLMNDAEEPINGRLMMKMQKNENENWIDKEIAVNENIEVPENSYIELISGELSDENNNFIRDLFESWNEKNVSINEPGNYRVYASFEYDNKRTVSAKEFEVVEEQTQSQNIFVQAVDFVKKIF